MSLKLKTIKIESNRTVINRLNRQRLNCPRCPPHKMENAGGSRRAHRSWKKYRKAQYKG